MEFFEGFFFSESRILQKIKKLERGMAPLKDLFPVLFRGTSSPYALISKFKQFQGGASRSEEILMIGSGS